MDKILAGLDFVRCYIDDIWVFSDTMEQHHIHLQIVFERLKAHGLRLHPKKCKFFQENVEYLDHVIYPSGMGVYQAKVKAIAHIPRLTDIGKGHAFMVVHRPGVANLDVDGLNRNPCTSQEDDTRVRGHGEADEEMMLGWHAFAFMCLLRGDSSREYHLTSCSNQRVDDQSLDPKVEGGATDQREFHDAALMLEFLRTNMVPDTVGAKGRDCVLQRSKRYRLERLHVFRVWKDDRVRVVPHQAQRARIVRHAHEELGHFGVKRTYNLLLGQYRWRDFMTRVMESRVPLILPIVTYGETWDCTIYILY
ncbi:hypothetical protein AXG93_2035s1120 [Marchantia polymorpha subsp. ruderalis]|uniref:Reverse transcriptase domain-containing protein n=1 Tax=Marchantia polymorpha subsp. ruderalis TaxID=1480154 RepID=A0A176VR04_MARPO|nr:hypothetical protein AXG93_2035s1120 [Marchantia polymorpha subsp. ruderalis]